MRQAFIILLLTPLTVLGQLNNVKGVLSTSLDKANNLYDLGFYNESIQYYKEGLKEDPSNQKGMERLATSYMKIGDYNNSWSHYAVLFDLTAVKDLEIVKNYAEVSLSTGDIEEASYWFTQASKMDNSNQVFKSKLEGIHNYSDFFKDSALVSIQPIALNTTDSEFALRPYKDGVSVVSSKSSDVIIQKNYLREVESFTDLYTYKGVNQKNDSSRRIIKLKNHLSSNDGPISQSDRFIAISRNNGKSRKNVKNTLGIFFYTLQEGKLIFDSEFVFNNKLYSNTHPWLNSRGDTLYYVSNMKGNYGGFDIYYSVHADYKWSIPVNLGKEINTEANELFPMIDNEQLYFSSNGHKGLGGLDNYKVNLSKENYEIINFGYPINSGFDDFSPFILSGSGFIASNRPGGKGKDDIYQFKITPAPKASFQITILDELNELPVENVSISYNTYQDSLSLLTASNGTISAIINPGDFMVRISKEGYESQTFPAIVYDGDVYQKNVFIEPILDLDIIAPDSIMFHLGKFELKKIAEDELLLIKESMSKYPHLKLMIAAHTDSRGKKEYNQLLSEKRAEAAFVYLVKIGVDSTRMSKSGFGETVLINDCKDGIKCSEEEHAANRRIEFFLSVEFEEETEKSD